MSAKPCPFCGFQASVKPDDDTPGMFRVYCEDCGASGPHHGAPDFAEEAWNTRSETEHAVKNRLIEVVDEVLTELRAGTEKFPTWPTDPLHAVGVVGEESGELYKAVLQQVYEPHKNKPDDVRKEAIQTAAMAIRFLLSLDRYDWTPGKQHSQSQV